MASRSLIILVSVVLTLLSFPPFNLYGLAFVALIPLFYVFTHSKHTALYGYLWGVLFMAGFNSWMLTLSAWGPKIGVICLWILSSCFFGLYTGIIGWIFGHLKKKIHWMPLIWILLEYLKSIGPFGSPGGIIGYSQASHQPFILLAKLGGVFLISAIIIAINALLFSAYENRSKKGLTYLLLGGILIMSSESLGFILKNQKEPTSQETLRVLVVQPNQSQDKKFQAPYWTPFRKEYLDLTEEALQKAPADLVVWAETITPDFNLERQWFMTDLKRITQTYQTHILFGTPYRQNDHIYNSAALISKDGSLNPPYNKMKLMPFGEYWPLKSLFLKFGLKNIIPGAEFSKGKNESPLSIHQFKIGPSICLESTYPGASRQFGQQGATVLCTLANNAWFLNSSAAEKHLQMTRLRAIEMNQYMIQSASTGISSIISNNGKDIQKMPLNTRGVIRATLPMNLKQSLYAKVGDLIIYVAFGILSIGYIRLKRGLFRN